MKKILTLGFLIALTLFSCAEKTDKVSISQRSGEFDVVPSCDTIEYPERDWYQEDRGYLFLSIFCFPAPANDSTALLGWDPKSYRVTKMDREFVFPDQTGNAGKVLMTDGTNVYWGDLPTP